MTADHRRNLGDDGIDIQIGDRMHQVKQPSAELDGIGWRKVGAVSPGIDVAANRRYRGDLFERVENAWVANVSGMKNVLDSGQRGERFGPQQSVRIGDDADEHRDQASRRLWSEA